MWFFCSCAGTAVVVNVVVVIVVVVVVVILLLIVVTIIILVVLIANGLTFSPLAHVKNLKMFGINETLLFTDRRAQRRMD